MWGALVKGCRSTSRRPSFMVAATFAAATQQNQVACDNLSAVLFFAALFVFPTRSLEPAFNIDLGSLLHVLAHDLRQPLPGHNVVPLCPVLPLAGLVFIPLVSGQAEFRHGNATGREFHFRVFSQGSRQNAFVYALCHREIFLCECWVNIAAGRFFIKWLPAQKIFA